MVDTAIDHSAFTAAAKTAALKVHIAFETDRDRIAARLSSLGPDVIYSGYQHPNFIKAWLAHAAKRPLLVDICAPGRGPVLLPMELCDSGNVHFIGSRHANGNFPIGKPRDIEALAGFDLKELAAAVRRNVPGAKIIVFERQLPSLNGIANPFVRSDSVASPNVALSFDISQEFDAVLAARNGKRKRKKFRSNSGKLEAMGTLTFAQPVDKSDIDTVLNSFFDMKAKRFAGAGIADVFSDAQTRGFFRDLFMNSADAQNTSHELQALLLDGKPIAVIGCTTHAKRYTVEFGTFDDFFFNASPGDLLFYAAVRNACERGFSIFDFGIGDEPYKRRWCDIETVQFDTVIPITKFGQVTKIWRINRARAVRVIKSNERIWSIAKTVRKWISHFRMR